jgi:hypothetical protein
MIIKDDSFGELVIECGEQFTVGTPKFNKDGGNYYNNARFFTHLENAIAYIARSRVNDCNDTLTLKEYLDRYVKIKDEIVQAVNNQTV